MPFDFRFSLVSLPAPERTFIDLKSCSKRLATEAMLATICVAQFDGRDLCDGVPLIGRLQRAGEQGILRHGLGREFGVDAGGAEIEQLLDIVAARRVDDVRRYHQIVIEKTCRARVVRNNASDARRRQENGLRA